MKNRIYGVVAAGAAAALVLSACGGGSDDGSSGGKAKVDKTSDKPVSFTVAADEYGGYNNLISPQYSTANGAVDDRMQPGFGYFLPDGEWQHGTDLGDYEKVSDDPLTIKYTINDKAVYQGGTPITCEDFYMDWVAQNPQWVLDGQKAANKLDDDGNPVSLFDHVSGSDTYALPVPKGPECEAGDKEFTVIYTAPNPDWELVISGALPSHVIAEKLGMTKEELFKAFKDQDFDVVVKAADAWNHWNGEGDGIVPGEVPSPEVAPSWGPYTLKEGGWKAGEYVTLVPNPDWWGEPAGTKELIVKQIKPEAMLQALANEDVNVIEPQATQDTIDQIKAMDNATLLQGSTLIWEHVDFNFGGTSIFANDKGGLALREAMAYCIPRQDIVDRLIKPLDPKAVVMNAREYFPTDTDYEKVVSESYDGRYDKVDIEKAKEKVAESGIANPVVRIGYNAGNQRRADQLSLIQASCGEAGITVEDISQDGFMSKVVGVTNDYDAALFAWSGSGQIVSGANIYMSTGGQNYGAFKNADVDKAWKTVLGSLDEKVWLENKIEIEKNLWNDLFGVPIFAHPGIAAYTNGLKNVEQNVTQSGIMWNAEQWTW